MAVKPVRIFFLAFIVLSTANLSFGQNRDIAEVPDKATSVPSIGDLMTVVDKATSDGTEGKDWSTPVKLVIIFSGLAILPSLLVMMTSFTRIVIVLSFVRRALSTQSIPPTIAIIPMCKLTPNIIGRKRRDLGAFAPISAFRCCGTEFRLGLLD